MEDNQCRTCLSDNSDSRFAIDKKVNGTTIDSMLESLTNLKMTEENGLSKYICRKCYHETISAYTFRTKCVDTQRTLMLALKSLERKLKELQDSKASQLAVNEVLLVEEQEILVPHVIQVDDDDHLIECEFDEIIDEDDCSSVAFAHESREEQQQQQQESKQFAEETEEYIEEYEDVEYLDESLNETSFSCSFCDPPVTFKTEYGQRKHQYEEHQVGSNPLICFSCNIEFKVNPSVSEEVISRSIQKHMFYHEQGMFNSCTKCFEVFKTVKQLLSHENSNHKKKFTVYKCRSCGLPFQSYYLLSQHLNSTACKTQAERTFQCYICNETFSRGVTKKKHIKESHKDKAGADCPLCLRCKIPSAVAFENHYRTHFVAPRFCCSYCGKPFHESDRMQTHIRRFHETSKYICFWCERTFKDKSGVTRHIMGVHFNSRNFKCEYCSKAFTTSYNLKEHQFSVHKKAAKIYTCDTCHQNFLYRKKFERHRNNCNGVPEKRNR